MPAPVSPMAASADFSFIADRMEGRLSVDSAPGRESVFSLELPVEVLDGTVPAADDEATHAAC